MSLRSRIANIFRGDHLSREIDEELQTHLADAIAHGRNPGEASRAFGSTLRYRENSRDVRLITWLDSLRADTVFGWRQLKKNKVASSAAVLSLALAIGACTSAFRLIDAMLLRPLPIAHADRLFGVYRQGFGPGGDFRISESNEYPLFQLMRDAVKGQAELIAVSYLDRPDVAFAGQEEPERIYRQYVSGSMFESFGLRPAVGRLLTGNDDTTLGAHPLAVLSHDFWTRRFQKDSAVIGRTFRMDSRLYEIAGVLQPGFTGTETGTLIDVFVPSMMNPLAARADASWFRTFAHLKPGAAHEAVRQRLEVPFRAFQLERSKTFANMPQKRIEQFLNQELLLDPAASGASGMQKDTRVSLSALGVLVALVLLIACANVTNLKTAQAAARAREMALRVAIGAGRWRLVQLTLVENAWLAFLSAAIGGVFAWWAAPFVVSRINPADNPARLVLPADWRVLGFGLLLALAVTFLSGLAPALRASSVRPARALKGGEDPHARRRLMHGMIALQVAFCFLVLFFAGLFVSSFDKLSKQPIGFSAAGVLALDTVLDRAQPQEIWEQVAQHLRSQPGVDQVAISAWTLLSGNGANGFIRKNGVPAGDTLAYFLAVTPGWIGTMKIRLISGRDLSPRDAFPGAALVNEAFVRQYFRGEDPIGKPFERGSQRFQIVGVTGDARYRNMREPITPTVYTPMQAASRATLLVRTSLADPMSLAQLLRREVSRARPEFRVSTVRPQTEIVQQHTVRERLLALLALFFAVVALAMAAVGLYGVLDYSVLQRRREIGIRMAIGARAGDITWRVTREVFLMVTVGAVAGLVGGFLGVRYVETLLYQVKPTDLSVLALPSLTIFVASCCAAFPPVLRAIRLDPAKMLRSE